MTEFLPFWNRSDDAPAAMRICAVGDVMLSRGVGRTIEAAGIDTLFDEVRSPLQEGITLGNLEGPISSRGVPNPGSHSHFRAAPDVVEGLVRAGFDVLHLANNHIHDFGSDAVEDTLGLLQEAGIRTLGVGRTIEEALRPEIVELAGFRFAFVGCTTMASVGAGAFVSAPFDPDAIERVILPLVSDGVRVVVSIHFGHESIPYPVPEQRRRVRRLLEMGADVVLGHHPHVLQGIETHEGGFAAYSLGNFLFDRVETEQRRSMIVRFGLDPKGLTGVEFLPVSIGADGSAAPARGTELTAIETRVRGLSAALVDGSSDRLFWETAGESFGETQASNLSKTFASSGWRGLLRLLGRVRPKHLRLAFVWVVRKLGLRRSRP